MLDLSITERAFRPVSQLFQVFMQDADGAYMARMVFDGQQSEHEDERGAVVLHDHPFHRGLDTDEVSPMPSRELWMRDGLQTFDPLITLR